MRPIELARALARLNETEDALRAYRIALQDELDPAEQMEAAVYILQLGKGDDYKISYTVFRDLYNRGVFRKDILDLMNQAFYQPNIRALKSRYDRNCKLLSQYRYIFRSDFPRFEELPLRFYPYDDNAYTPYNMSEERFGEYVNFRDAVIRHNFFHDLENPILAKDVYSQYELEYLRDNVRASEDVARENHIYLHYTSWPVFCSYLACLNWKPLLDSGKFVFLFEEEISRYPIDFKEEFGIDYSQLTLQPVRVREVTKLIWHTQLSTHNGGDFFNEIFDAHPNLLCLPSMMLSHVEKIINKIREIFERAGSLQEAMKRISGWPPQAVEELYRSRNRTDKDILVGMFLNHEMATAGWDRASRITPAVFFQPHFSNILYSIKVDEKDRAILSSESYERIKNSPVFQGFKYIKTFTPMRRFTTSHGATVRFMYNIAQVKNQKWDSLKDDEKEKRSIVSDAVLQRVLNRSFMIDPQDRLYHDSIVVRLEDAKLNPKAAFTALAAFLDLPYAESMTRCTIGGEAYSRPWMPDGFDTAPVYKTYDDFVNDNERKFIEYFLRDAYEYYGYDFHYYNGEHVDEAKVKEWLVGFDTIDSYMSKTWRVVFSDVEMSIDGEAATEQVRSNAQDQLLERFMRETREKREKNVEVLMWNLRFVNQNGQPLYMTPMLELDPALMEQPLYH